MEDRRSFFLQPGIGFLLLLFVLGISSGCRKTSKSNPCDDVLNEGSPVQVALLFMDGKTGENILLSKNIEIAAITITPSPTDVNIGPGVIVNQPGSPLHGALLFQVTDTKTGNFSYKIDIGGDDVTLTYSKQQLKSNNPCKPFYISLSDPAIAGHPYTLLRSGSRLLFNITL